MKKVNVFWFRRDLRLDDNAGLYHSLKNSDCPTLCIFIFDPNILNKLPKNDLRVNFIHNTLMNLKKELAQYNSDLMVIYDTPEQAWSDLLKSKSYTINAAYTNSDYEPSAIKRDLKIKEILKKHSIDLHSYKDQVIYEPGELLTGNGQPYTVYTPFAKKWKQSLTDFYITSYPNKKYFKNFLKISNLKIPTLHDIGFNEVAFKYPESKVSSQLLKNYDQLRNFPAQDSTSKLGLHFRFGTISIRSLAVTAIKENEVWLNELIWREFFMHLLFFFPKTTKEDFRPNILAPIEWENDADKFEKWKNGQTGFPLIDAGMRELNQTGFMHNRVRMVVASFLVKILLIHWKYGERYFAEKLLDYDLSSNIGNWQWCAGCGADAAPYFRIFNPNTQIDKFDPNYTYIKKWVPEFGTDSYPSEMIDLSVSRNRFLNFYKNL